MYIKTIFLLLFFTLQLFGKDLQRNYFVNDDAIKLSAIIPTLSPEDDAILFQLSKTQHIYRIKATELLKILNQHGFKGYTSPYPYIQFNKISPIDTSKLKHYLKQHYQLKYQEIDIKAITIFPRYYMETMPKNYTIDIRPHEHLSKEGVLSIKTDDNKKIFFNYEIKASLQVYVLKNSLQRNAELSITNTSKHSIILDKFRAMPLQNIKNGNFQLKHTMEKGEFITLRDIEPITLIKKDSSVNVTLTNGSIVITFSARALQNGKLGDIIFVENDKGKKIKAIVTGRNKAKVK